MTTENFKKLLGTTYFRTMYNIGRVLGWLFILGLLVPVVALLIKGFIILWSWSWHLVF